jgi:hypothetical protein
MSIDKNTAMIIWNSIYGSQTQFVLDCFGTYICKMDYGDYDTTRQRPGGDGKDHQYGWDVDHIRPKASFDDESEADFYNNYEPMHRENNIKKSDHFPGFSVGKTEYTVVNCEICTSNGKKGYGIQEVLTGKRIDWKGVRGKCF